MKLLIALISIIFLFQACEDEESFKTQDSSLNQDLELDYQLDNSLDLQVQYYEFDTLDLSLDMD